MVKKGFRDVAKTAFLGQVEITYRVSVERDETLYSESRGGVVV